MKTSVCGGEATEVPMADDTWSPELFEAGEPSPVVAAAHVEVIWLVELIGEKVPALSLNRDDDDGDKVCRSASASTPIPVSSSASWSSDGTESFSCFVDHFTGRKYPGQVSPVFRHRRQLGTVSSHFSRYKKQ